MHVCAHTHTLHNACALQSLAVGGTTGRMGKGRDISLLDAPDKGDN